MALIDLRMPEVKDVEPDELLQAVRVIARGDALLAPSVTCAVISASAAIMVVVFLSVVLGADVGLEQIELGLAVAVLIDATVVRLVLVPAVSVARPPRVQA